MKACKANNRKGKKGKGKEARKRKEQEGYRQPGRLRYFVKASNKRKKERKSDPSQDQAESAPSPPIPTNNKLHSSPIATNAEHSPQCGSPAPCS